MKERKKKEGGGKKESRGEEGNLTSKEEKSEREKIYKRGWNSLIETFSQTSFHFQTF